MRWSRHTMELCVIGGCTSSILHEIVSKNLSFFRVQHIVLSNTRHFLSFLLNGLEIRKCLTFGDEKFTILSQMFKFIVFEVLLRPRDFLFASHMSRNVISRRLARRGHSNFIHSRFIHVKIVRWEIISFNTPRIVSFLVGVYHIRQRYIVLRNGHTLSEFSCLVPNSLRVS